MTYEQIFAGQLRLAQAINHVRNRSLSLGNCFGIRFSDRGGSYSMPRAEWDAVRLMEDLYYSLDNERDEKRAKRRSA